MWLCKIEPLATGTNLGIVNVPIFGRFINNQAPQHTQNMSNAPVLRPLRQA